VNIREHIGKDFENKSKSISDDKIAFEKNCLTDDFFPVILNLFSKYFIAVFCLLSCPAFSRNHERFFAKFKPGFDTLRLRFLNSLGKSEERK